MSHENRLRRLEVLATINQVHRAEYSTLIMQILTCPGQYTSVQIARAFDRLLTKQNEECLTVVNYLETKCPVEGSSEDVRAQLKELGFQIVDEEEQLELPFPELENETDRKSNVDLDLFGDDDFPPLK